MATIQETIRRLVVQATTSGVAEATRALAGFKRAQEDVAVASERTERATQSNARAVENIRRRYDDAYRRQVELARVERELNTARQRGEISLREQTRLMGLAEGQAGRLSGRFSVIASEAQGMSASLGVAGRALAGIGVAGLAAGAAIAVAGLGMKQAADAAFELADKAGKLVDLSQSIGLTTDHLQALAFAASQVGQTSEQMTTALERFAVQFAQLRRNEGELFEQIRAVNPELAQQMSRVQTLTEAFDLYSRALREANELDRARLNRAAFGRGGIGTGRIVEFTAERGGLDALVKSMDRADIRTREFLNRIDEAADRTKFSWEKARENFFSSFATPTLEWLGKIVDKILELSRKAAEFMSGIGGTGGAAGTGGPAQITVGPNPQGEFARLERQREEAIRYANSLRDLQSAMQGTAAPAQQLQLALALLDKAWAEGKFGGNLDAYKEAQARIIQQFKDRSIQAHIGALGEAASQAERYAAELSKLQTQLKNGEINQRTFDRAAEELKQALPVEEMRRTVQALGEAATQTERYNLRVAELEQQLRRGEISQEAFNRAVKALDPILKTVMSAFDSFMPTFLQGLANGDSAVQALTASVRGLGNQLISLGSRQVMQGLNTILTGGGIGAGLATAGPGAAIALIGTAISGIFGMIERRDQRREELQRQQQEGLRRMEERIRDLQDRVALSRLDTQTLQGALAAFDISAARERAAVGGGKGRGSREAQLLEEALANERLAIIQRFADDAIAAEKRRADEIAKLQQDLEDRLFAATTDTTTLAGQLAAFDRRAARERIEIARESAELLPLLEETLAAERLQIIQDFNERAIDEQRRLAEEFRDFIANLRRTIQQFIDNLRGGAGSFLSPNARLAAAQQAFNQQLALAQGGDQTALGSITQYAQNLIEAGRAVFGSTTGFQTLVTTIIGQLEALPDLVAANDPIVAAIEAAQASNDTLLQSLVTLADLNNDGMVDQNELLTFIRGNTGSTATSTGSTATSSAAVSSNTSDIEFYSALIRENARAQVDSLNQLYRISENTARGWQYVNQGVPAVASQHTSAPIGGKAGFELGGLVPGSGPMGITVHGGEFVMTAATVRRLGTGFFQSLQGGGNVTEELRALRAEVAAFRRENGMNLAANSNITMDSAKGVASAVYGAGARRDRDERQQARRPQVA